jgi:hypothetical protein
MGRRGLWAGGIGHDSYLKQQPRCVDVATPLDISTRRAAMKDARARGRSGEARTGTGTGKWKDRAGGGSPRGLACGVLDAGLSARGAVLGLIGGASVRDLAGGGAGAAPDGEEVGSADSRRGWSGGAGDTGLGGIHPVMRTAE